MNIIEGPESKPRVSDRHAPTKVLYGRYYVLHCTVPHPIGVQESLNVGVGGMTALGMHHSHHQHLHCY